PAPRDRPSVARRSVGGVPRARGSPGRTLDRLPNRSARSLREGGDARTAKLHPLGEGADLSGAVAAGFEPARGLPPYTLSRRAPSSARAGHRSRVYEVGIA